MQSFLYKMYTFQSALPGRCGQLSKRLRMHSLVCINVKLGQNFAYHHLFFRTKIDFFFFRNLVASSIEQIVRSYASSAVYQENCSELCCV